MIEDIAMDDSPIWQLIEELKASGGRYSFTGEVSVSYTHLDVYKRQIWIIRSVYRKQRRMFIPLLRSDNLTMIYCV